MNGAAGKMMWVTFVGYGRFQKVGQYRKKPVELPIAYTLHVPYFPISFYTLQRDDEQYELTLSTLSGDMHYFEAITALYQFFTHVEIMESVFITDYEPELKNNEFGCSQLVSPITNYRCVFLYPDVEVYSLRRIKQSFEVSIVSPWIELRENYDLLWSRSAYQTGRMMASGYWYAA